MIRVHCLAALCALAAFLAPAAARAEEQSGFVGLQIAGEEGKVVVHDVVADGPAAKAGIKAGDVIVKVGDKEVKDPMEAVAAVRAVKPGAKLKFHVKRDGKDQDIEVTVGKRPAEPKPPPV
jgi:S1-C subfamily serine protease